MTKPVPDKAEVAIEYPDKFYIGTFERTSRFEAHLDRNGISLKLERPGSDNERKSIHLHVNYELFAEILRDLADTVAAFPADDLAHRESLTEAAAALHAELLRLGAKPTIAARARKASAT
jgi:hypothetical protein